MILFAWLLLPPKLFFHEVYPATKVMSGSAWQLHGIVEAVIVGFDITLNTLLKGSLSNNSCMPASSLSVISFILLGGLLRFSSIGARGWWWLQSPGRSIFSGGAFRFGGSPLYGIAPAFRSRCKPLSTSRSCDISVVGQLPVLMECGVVAANLPQSPLSMLRHLHHAAPIEEIVAQFLIAENARGHRNKNQCYSVVDKPVKAVRLENACYSSVQFFKLLRCHFSLREGVHPLSRLPSLIQSKGSPQCACSSSRGAAV